MKIVFICLGNICRSPLAEAVAKKYVQEHNKKNIEISSAGTADWHIGKTPCPKSMLVAKNFNLDISGYRGYQITNSNAKNYDYLIAVDQSTYSHTKAFDIDNDKVFKLGYFGLNNADIPDTYYIESQEEINNVYNMIEKSVYSFMDFIISKQP